MAEVRVLLDPGDDMQVSVGLLERHDPARGQVVVHPTPGARSDALTDSVLPSPASPCTHIIALAASTSARLSRSISRASVATTFAPASPR